MGRDEAKPGGSAGSSGGSNVEMGIETIRPRLAKSSGSSTLASDELSRMIDSVEVKATSVSLLRPPGQMAIPIPSVMQQDWILGKLLTSTVPM